MLNSISPLLSPDLLKTLAEMGHSEAIVFADANFPAYSCNERVIRADGLGIPPLLEATLPLFPLDTYASWQVGLMETVEGDPTPPVWKTYDAIIKRHYPQAQTTHIERFRFYDEVKDCFAVVATSETALYGNIMLRKGVVVPSSDS